MIKIKCICLYLVLVFVGLSAVSGQAAENQVYLLKISDAISPGVADFINTGINKAAREKAACIIIELDTPGGLAESMREIIMTILGTSIPVIVYVAPSGARAASAGVMITMAADIAAMAPGTNIGAAHPVAAGGEKIDDTMSAKITNDMVAHARSVAEKNGRNVEWVEKAIRESVSVTETEALEQNIIDLIAEDVDDLISQINTREIKGKGVLNLEKPEITVIKEGLRTKILKTISDPNIAYILMMIGLAGLYFELSHPGAIFPGVVGGICLILAFFAFQTLAVNYAGILLIGLAIILFIMEIKITSYGLLSIAGVISLLLGSLMLFEGNQPEMRLAWQVLIPTLAMVSGFFIIIAGLVVKSHVSQPKTGAEGLIGEVGEVLEDLNPEGRVFIHGEIWNARASGHLARGTRVRVRKIDNLVIDVDAL